MMLPALAPTHGVGLNYWQRLEPTPGGWVYEIHPDYDRNGAVPPHAIRGAWKVDDDGNLTGEYVATLKDEHLCL